MLTLNWLFLLLWHLFSPNPPPSGGQSQPRTADPRPQPQEELRLFLAGDVMLGRGIDQIMKHSVDPTLHESYVKNAERYVELAERASGEIPRDVPYTYIWGDALTLWKAYNPKLRLINLETSVTTSDHYWPDKAVHYRMHPENVEALQTADIDYCALANNHVLDWGYPGLKESLEALNEAGIPHSGAGLNLKAASAPSIFPLSNGHRLLVFACGLPSSGVYRAWAASEKDPGVFYLPGYTDEALSLVQQAIGKYRQPGDLIVLSIHWGSNWGYEVSAARRRFAHQLIDEADVDLIYGHSSHHPRGMEVYRERLILYGCGDFINDYEGIGGHEEYRPSLSLMYFPTLDMDSGRLLQLKMEPMRIRRFQLHKAGSEEAEWLSKRLSKHSEGEIEPTEAGALSLRWK